MSVEKITEYYNKFNEDKRLQSRHGQVEYTVTMEYIHRYLREIKESGRLAESIKIADIGAGTGAYAIPLFEEGYAVTAVELVQHNLGLLKQKNPNINAFKGNALKLKRLESNQFDITILLGPLYHLAGREQKLQALLEAKRITVTGGVIFAGYCLNDYSVLQYGIRENHLLELIEKGQIDKDFHVVATDNDLYDYVRKEDVDWIRQQADLEQYQIFSPDGPTDYIRPMVNAMEKDFFDAYLHYVRAISGREELLYAGSHIVDVLRKR